MKEKPSETDPRLEQFIRDMPKVELHLHMEGSIPAETLLGFIKRKGTEPDIRTVEDLNARLTYTDFPHFIEVWTWKNTFIHDEKDFRVIAHDVLSDLARQNVKYVEAFFGPGDYRRMGLSIPRIIKYVIQGKEKAEADTGIRCNLIIDLIRDHGPEIGMQRLEEATPYLGKGIIGVGIGGSEQLFPPEPYEAVYREARKRGFRLTAHAGEVAGPESMWGAIRTLGAERLGHGVRANEDPELVAYLIEHQLPLEMCPISNVKTGVCESIGRHPIREYFDKGIMVTVNADDPAMFQSSLTEDYLAVAGRLGFGMEEIKRLAANSIDASFLSSAEKAALYSGFQRDWADWEASRRR